MKKRIALLMGTVMVMTSLAACGGSKPAPSAAAAPASEAAQEKTSEAEKDTAEKDTSEKDTAEAAETFDTVKVRVAYMPNMGSASLATTAKEMGYFKEMGLDVDMVEFQGGPAEIAAMASGDIDIAQIGHGAHALCAEGEAVIFQIDCTSLADAVIGNKDKGTGTIEGLKGKTVAVTSGTSAEIILNLALQSAGMTQDDIEMVEMDANGIVSAMISGNVDACATWSPGTQTIMNALGDKGVMLADNQDYVDQVTFPSSFITTQKYADANHDILVRFSRALQKAGDYRADHIEEVAKWVAKQCEVDESTMLATVGEGNWLTGEFVGKGLKDGTIKAYYENQQKVFIDSGRLSEPVDVDTYVLFDVMQEAYDENHQS